MDSATLIQIVQFVIMVGICIVFSIVSMGSHKPIPYLLSGFAWVISAVVNLILSGTGFGAYLSWFFGVFGAIFIFAAILEYVRGLGDGSYLKRYGTEPI